MEASKRNPTSLARYVGRSKIAQKYWTSNVDVTCYLFDKYAGWNNCVRWQSFCTIQESVNMQDGNLME